MIKERGELESITVRPGTLITPAARQFLQERRIKLVVGEAATPALPGASPPAEQAGTATAAASKPEYLTHLHGRELVPKTHPRIRLRGQLDSLEAHILLARVTARKMGYPDIDKGLGEVLGLVRRMLRAEVLEEPLPAVSLLGLNEGELRRYSHNPRLHLGVDHFVPEAEQGELMVWLNLVRTQVREVELQAMHTFWREGESPDRLDILQGLNRLSSALYILMCRAVAAGERGAR